MARRCLLPREAFHLRRQRATVGVRPFPRNRVPDLNNNNNNNNNNKKYNRSLSNYENNFKLSLTGRNAVQRFPWRCTYSQIYLHSRKCSSVNATPLPSTLTTFQLKLCNLSFLHYPKIQFVTCAHGHSFLNPSPEAINNSFVLVIRFKFYSISYLRR